MNPLSFLFPKLLYRGIDESGNTIEVLSLGNELVLKFNGITYSKLNKGSVFTHQYWDYFLPLAYIFENPRVMIIGFGGGTIAYQLESLLGEKISITAFEPNSKMIEASRHFLPKETKARIIREDAYTYISKLGPGSFDLIFLDAYQGSTIPPQFLSDAFATKAKRILSEEGILAINYAPSFMGWLTYMSYVTMLKQHFLVYRIATAITEGNIIILASKVLDNSKIAWLVNKNMPKNEDTEELIRHYSEMKKE